VSNDKSAYAAGLSVPPRLLYDSHLMPVAEVHHRTAAAVNEKKKGQGEVHFLGLHPFGPSTVARYTLSNGLTILLLADRSAPVVSYHTWFKVGSRHEKPGKTGLAHLFEHLMFNETESLKAGEFDKKLEESGAESNAATWVDWTYYHEAVPKDRLGLVIKLESDRMHNLVLRDAQVGSEKEVVANERRYRVDDDVEGAASELLYKTAFETHGYHWPTIGWMEDIQGFSPEDCTAFYKTYYAPNNATVVVVGDFNDKQLLGRILDAYGELPAAIIPPDDTLPEPPQMAPRSVEIKKPTATEKLLVGYHGPALGDVDHTALTVLTEILFGGRASRLYRALIIEGEICSEVRGWVSTFADAGLFEIYTTARVGKTIADIETVLFRELARVRDDVVTADELVRAKARLELGLLQSLETMNGKAEQIGFYETVLGDPGAAFQRLEAYRRVTASELRKAARRYIVDRAQTTIRVLPDAAERTSEAAE
jgi:zinc protease